MNYLQRLEHWGEVHHPKYLDLLRIAFGIFLCIKGVEFARNTGEVINLMGRQVPFNSFIMVLLSHYLIFAHIVGGFLIALGLLTRAACIAQIPILLGAIFFVNWNVMQPFSELMVTVLTLGLLGYFFVIGSGPWSLDRAIESGAVR